MFKNLCPPALGISGRDSEIIELAMSHGFKGIDVDLVEFAEQAKTQGVARASRLITSARLKFGSFRLPVRWSDDSPDYQADLEKFASLAPLAAEIGCTRATTIVEPGSERRPYHENFEFQRRRLAELGDALRPHKMRLGVGFLAPVKCRAGCRFQFMQTLDEIALLVRSVGAANVGLAFDSWHWHLGGGTLESLRALSADAIVTVSLADAAPNTTAADARLEERLIPGGGAIDMAALLTALADLHYDGPVTPAPDKSQFAGLGRDKIVKLVGAALETLWKGAGLNAAGRRSAVPGR